MDNFDIDECTCPCHTNFSIMHFMACCEKCSICGKNIRYNLMDEHLKKHNSNKKEENIDDSLRKNM